MSSEYHRSPLLMSPEDTALLVVDVQDKLLSVIDGADRVLGQCRFLVEGARLLGVRTVATEQYPKGLGPTNPSLAELLDSPVEKMTFSSCGAAGVLDVLRDAKIAKVLVCGIESHVCVQQTAFDLQANGFSAYLAVDAVGSRRAEDREWSLRRMAEAGISLTTSEAAVFEWTRTAEAPNFRDVSKLVKSQG